MKPNSKSYTLIELIIVIVVSGIIAGLFGMLIFQVIDVYSFVTIRENILSESELAAERMVREIRQIKDASNIYTADTEEFEFVDVDDNIIEFKKVGEELFRNNNLLAEGISNLVFKYWDENNVLLTAPVAAPENIKRIGIRLEMTNMDQEVRIDTQVYPRNL